MEPEKSNVEIIRPNDVLQKMLDGLRNGQEKGTTTYIPDLDKCWKWRKGEFNIWTGYSNEGKSQFLRFLFLIKILVDGWKFLICAPEDFPPEDFFDDCVHTLTGQPTDKDHPKCVSEEDYMTAFNLIKNSFVFVHIKPPGNTVYKALEEFRKLMAEEEYDGVLIDPLMKFARPKEVSERDDIYAGYLTSICTEFSRETKTSTHLVMHQQTPKISEGTGLYPKPNMYAIKGGGSYSDGTDNILSVWRENYAKDKLDTSVKFASMKIKKHKLVGIPQEFDMKFDRKTNRYMDKNDNPLFNFEKYTGIVGTKTTLF